MSGNKTTYWENTVLSDLPSTLYLALFTADPGVAGAMTNELPNANGYQRMAITLTTASNGQRSNNADIIWPAYTGTNNPVVTYVGLVDSATIGSGNMYYHAAANPSQTLANGTQFKIASGTYTITES